MNTIFKPLAEITATLSESGLRWPGKRESLLLLALTSLGLIGNFFNVELFFGVNFIFGSIVTMIALRTSGILWGTLVGIIIGSYSYVLWGHPYAILIFGLEAFVVGFFACCLKKDNMIMVDVGYWIFVGVPLVWVLYSYPLGLPEPAVNLIALKQMANGITNVVLACFLIQFTPIRRVMNVSFFASAGTNLSMYSAINTLLAIFIFLPMLTVTIITGQSYLERIEENLQLHVEQRVEQAGRELTSTLHNYAAILASTATIALNQDN